MWSEHRIVHRSNMRPGTARCGATGDIYVSISGAPSTVTCPECRAMEAAHRPICTVHASSKCLEPNGPRFDGMSDIPRVECRNCYAYLSA